MALACKALTTPRTAIEGTYVDKKCPWTGSVNIRGKLLTGVIKTTKMKNTVIIRKDYLHFIKKYNRLEKRHKNTPAWAEGTALALHRTQVRLLRQGLLLLRPGGLLVYSTCR